MLSEAQQTRVWEGMLASEIRANYFAELSAQYLSRQRYSTLGALILSSGAFASLLVNSPMWLRLLFTLLAAVISLYSFVMQNQKLAFDAADLHDRWNRLAKDYARLWEDVDADGALGMLEELVDRGSGLSKSGLAFPNRKRAMLKWQDYVEQQHAHA